MREYKKRCIFYYLDNNNKKHQISSNIILLSPYHGSDLEKTVYNLLDKLSRDNKINKDQFIYCKIKVDIYDQYFYHDNIKYYFNGYANKRYKRKI